MNNPFARLREQLEERNAPFLASFKKSDAPPRILPARTAIDRRFDLPHPFSADTLVTPQLAAEKRRTAHFERQRDIDKSHVDQLVIQILNGHFVELTQIYICVLPDMSEYVVNGNHTLEALIKADIPYWLSIVYCPVHDLEEVARIYARFDIQKVRNWRARMRALGVGDLLGTARWSETYGSAITCIFERFYHAQFDTQIRTDADIRAPIMREWQEYADLYVTCVSNGTTETIRLMRRSLFMAPAIEMFRYQPSKAREFWSVFAEDNGLLSGDPRRALLQYMRNLRNKDTHTVSMRITIRAVALAWNAFFKGSELAVCKPNQMGEFILAGTPWRDGFNPIEAYLPELFRSRIDSKSV